MTQALKLLIVDDEPAIRRLLSASLHWLCFQITTEKEKHIDILCSD